MTRCVTNWHDRGCAGRSNEQRSEIPHGEIDHFPRRLNTSTSDSTQNKSFLHTPKSVRLPVINYAMQSSTNSDVKQSEAGQSDKKSTRTMEDTSISTWSSRESETSDLPMLSMYSGTIQTFKQFAASLPASDMSERMAILRHQLEVTNKIQAATLSLLEEAMLSEQYESSLQAIPKTTLSTNRESRPTYVPSRVIPKKKRLGINWRISSMPLRRSVTGIPQAPASFLEDQQEQERPSSPDASGVDSDQTVEYLEQTSQDEEPASSDTKTNSSPSKQAKHSSSMI